MGKAEVMKKNIKIMTNSHTSIVRDYSTRSTKNKPENAKKAKLFEYDYWDGSREHGYGGYVDDGRWALIALKFIKIYNLNKNSSILDIGCGKAYLLNEIKKIIPLIHIVGIDVSSYAISCAPENISMDLFNLNILDISFDRNSFDLVTAINVLHNLELPQLFKSLQIIQKVSSKDAYICVESYRNESEKWNLLQWQLTCECFYTPMEWEWIFHKAGYTGHYEFIYFS